MSIKNHHSRLNPYPCRIRERFLLTGPNSTKKTFHISLEIDARQFPFQVGDSIAILVQNDPEEVDELLEKLKRAPDEPFFDPRSQTSLSLKDYLLTKTNIRTVNSAFLKSLLPMERELFLPENKGRLNEHLHSHSLLDLLDKNSGNPDLTKLMPLLPRFYSIANSPLVFPNEIHLTVSYVSYITNGKERRGIASYYLCALTNPAITPISIYLQPSHSFFLPENPNASIILVGPGTGIAPFRAFLQERIALQAEGRNWLFFGERNRASDFYYQEFFTALEKEGRLRLDLAFSRDTQDKIYVQHKMYEERKSLWEWIHNGAYFFVCGDAEEMAKDVDITLHRIAREVGGLSEEDARHYIKRMRAEKRYCTDVY